MIEVRRSTHASTEDLWGLLSAVDNWADMLPTIGSPAWAARAGQPGPLVSLARLLAGSKAQRMVEQEGEAFVRLAEHAR